MASNGIGFALNFANLYEIDTTPGGASRTWERIAAGINSAEWSGNESISQDPYYDGGGAADSEVTGGQMTCTFGGHRKYGDAAQDYIASLMLSYGDARRTNFRWTAPNGDVIESACTVVEITPSGGEPNSKGSFGFGIHLNGVPRFTPGEAEGMPTAIEAQDVTVKVGESKEVVPQITPAGASPAVAYLIDDDSVATVTSDGVVRGVKDGTATLRIMSAAKPSVSKDVKVTVSTM